MELKDRKQLLQDWIRRVVAYTDRITFFGGNSITRALGRATADLVEGAFRLYVALVRRFTVLNAQGDDLAVVAAERGATRRGKSNAKLLVIVQPYTANVAGIVNSMGDDYIEIDDSSFILAGDSFRIRNADGSVSETATIASISVGTGPVHGYDEIVVTGGLSGTYSPSTEDVDVLIRVTVPAETELSSSVGVSFHTLEAVVTGDMNPVLDGESTALGLADKVWAECTTAGTSGNIDALTITGFTAGIVRGVKQVFNPEPGSGGEDTESDLALKYRTIHGPADATQETLSWLEERAKAANSNVLRAVRSDELILGTLTGKVLHRNGGTFSTTQLSDMAAHMAARMRSYLGVELSNVTLTAVEVEASITLTSDKTLEDVGRAAASALAKFLDYRKWDWGASVDEADLLSIVNAIDGVASLETASFLPASDVAVAPDSLPVLARVTLRDTATGNTYNATLSVSF